MVTIVNYSKRMNSDGEEFFTLILQGDLELVKSQQKGRFYAATKKASLPLGVHKVDNLELKKGIQSYTHLIPIIHFGKLLRVSA